MDEQQGSSCGERAAVQRRCSLAQSAPTLLYTTMARWSHSLPLCLSVVFSSKGFLSDCHFISQSLQGACCTRLAGSRVTHLGGDTLRINVHFAVEQK